MTKTHYVGVVRTSYHLLNFLAFLEKHKKKEDNAEIIYSPYWDSSELPIDLKDYCAFLNIKVVLTESNLLSNVLINKVKVPHNNLQIVAVSLHVSLLLKVILFKLYKNVDVFFIDDGIGSYSGFIARLKAVQREKNKYYLLLFPFYYYTQKMLARIIGEKFAMLEPSTWNVNIDYKTSMLTVLQKLKSDEAKLYKPSIVFCTQPYVDLKVLSASEYTQILDSIFKISKINGWELIIRKHPADRVFDYTDFHVSDNNELFESFLMCNTDKIKSVISIDSTCLLTASALFNINSSRVDCSISRLNYATFNYQLKSIFERYTKKLNVGSHEE
jgi:hypothetical protein